VAEEHSCASIIEDLLGSIDSFKSLESSIDITLRASAFLRVWDDAGEIDTNRLSRIARAYVSHDIGSSE
jgi:hypothetical protein